MNYKHSYWHSAKTLCAKSSKTASEFVFNLSVMKDIYIISVYMDDICGISIVSGK